ncbi:bestrophin family protein [Tenacibaculum sp. SG-28]|uniref:bestrophin family protein n=1 Tax=Tenacibaculum sp. SG-28 TaxID=754426 RepID=UPI001E60BBCB|nr:bestrophin family ion channel [Tenacibaculum sp. SG-28]
MTECGKEEKFGGGIVNSSRSFTIMVKDFIVASGADSENQLHEIHRTLVHRHVAWLTALRYQLRAERTWENHLKLNKSNIEYRAKNLYVLEDNIPLEEAISSYLSEEEQKKIFSKGNRASQILGVQSEEIKKLHQKGYIDDFRHMEIEKIIVELYTLQGKSERIKNFPYPRQFATLNFVFVWIFIILLPFGMMQEFEVVGHKILVSLSDHEVKSAILHQLQVFVAQHFVWLSIPFSTLVSWVFFTMEAVGENSENPFEGGPNDVPITDLSRGIEIDIRELINDTEIPEAYTWKNNVIL